MRDRSQGCCEEEGARVIPGGALMGKQGGASGAGNSLRILWIAQGEVAPLFGEHLIEERWPFHGQKTVGALELSHSLA